VRLSDFSDVIVKLFEDDPSVVSVKVRKVR
jgi:hypothetical protein